MSALFWYSIELEIEIFLEKKDLLGGHVKHLL